LSYGVTRGQHTLNHTKKTLIPDPA